ncbi:HTH-type transcriptional regulator DmlR [Paraburkholderia caffeinitolerans]|uniref:HTH-type transcriptional regulator DmlR n=1 Tax=Paraburkholderia caffeinitolerans TaxID=1723730 RepID=A0A6J5G6Y0_9BURK|nr:LysR family transcriptional regulator [Paraburkholderia caffeinitolerans]CAB3794139.1 HTH-type transcriptional regulator DmlR [Paraburkholderia caffeinitolerans]
MDRLQTMQIYVNIVERGSFTQAAEVLQLHRPAVTKAVQQLEQELGIRLLNRSTRRVSMTAEGEAFYQRCVQLLASVNDTFASFAQFSEQRPQPKGRLRLNFATAFAKSVIIPALPEFQQRYPQIELVVGASDQPVDLIGEGIDCVVRIGELRDSSMVARKIGAVPMVTCASPSYLARHGVPRTLDDLRAHKAVNFFTGRNRRVIDWTFRPAGETVTLKLESSVLTDNSEALLACALAGFGLVHALRPALQPHIDAGQLVEVLPGIASAPKPISVMYANRDHLPGKVRVFVDWISEFVGRRYPA